MSAAVVGVTVDAVRALLEVVVSMARAADKDEAAEVARLLSEARARLDAASIGVELDEITQRHLERVRDGGE